MTNSFADIPNYWDLSSNMTWNPGAANELGKTTGGNMFGGDDIALAGIGAAGGLLSGWMQQRSAKDIARQYKDAQLQGMKRGINFQRDAAKGNAALAMFAPVFGATTAADLDFGRQAMARRMELGEFTPKQMGLDREQATWTAGFRASPLFQEAARKERFGNLQATIAAARAQPTGMFGPIAQAPIQSLMV